MLYKYMTYKDVEKQKEWVKNYQQENKDKINRWRKVYYQENKDKIKKYNKEYNKKNRLKKIRVKKIRVKREKDYTQIRIYKNRWCKEKRKISKDYRINSYLRNRLNTVLKLNRSKKQSNTLDYVGCNVNYLLEHLGNEICKLCNSINNIQIDHIIPFNYYIKEKGGLTEENIYKVMNYTNLQWLCKKCNNSKSGKY